MKRSQIITIVAFIAVVGLLGAVYRFYVQERLTKYAKDATYLAGLEKKYKDLSEKFLRTEPEVIIDAYLNKVDPWIDALDRRTDYYTLGGIREIEPVPENEDSRWYYIREAPKLIKEVSDAAYEQNTQVLTDLWFQSPPLEQLASVSVESSDVEKWLKNIKMGGAIVQQLLAAKALRIDQVALWPMRSGALVDMYTVGVSMYIRLEDLAAFLNDTLSDRQQCYFVNSIRIRNRVLTYDNPALEVQLIYTISEMRPTAETAPAQIAGGTEAGSAPGSPTRATDRGAQSG